MPDGGKVTKSWATWQRWGGNRIFPTLVINQVKERGRRGTPRPSRLSIRMETTENRSLEGDHERRRLRCTPWGKDAPTRRPDFINIILGEREKSQPGDGANLPFIGACRAPIPLNCHNLPKHQIPSEKHKEKYRTSSMNPQAGELAWTGGVLTAHSGGPELRFPAPMDKLGAAVHNFNSGTGKQSPGAH